MIENKEETLEKEEILEETAAAESDEASNEAEKTGSAEESRKQEADSVEQAEEGEAAADATASAAGETEESETADEAAGDSAAGTEKKSFFKKKKDKRDEQIEELNDKLKRQMAEFDNFRKRTEKEKTQMYDMGAKTIIEKILPVVDNFERGLAAVLEEQKEDAFVMGMDKIYKQLMTELEAMGVKPIEAVGQEFDPEYHNAVMQVESEEYDSGVVAQELQKGYTYKETVVRHSMVAVVS